MAVVQIERDTENVKTLVEAEENAFLEGVKAFELSTDLPYAYKEGTVLAKAWLKGWKHGWLEFHGKNNQ